MHDTNQPALSGPSPFDAIRRTRDDGTEFWSARDLMPLLGYDSWRRFADAIDRAKTAVEAQGNAVTSHFAGAVKNPGAEGGRPAEDVELTRFAAYQVAMCGDPRKPEVAAALAYFAIRTREAETAQQVDMSDPLAVIEAESARVAKAVEIARGERIRADRAERRLAVEQRRRAAIEGGDGIDLTTFGKKYFSDVRKTDFDKHLYSQGYLINQHNTRERADGSFADGYDHRKPTAKGREFIYAHDTGNYGGRRRFVPRVRPQREIALRDALASEGLPVNEHSSGLVLLSADELKELGA
ncbi:hypothetical protein MYK68_16120 [Gordonia sp. PP30]|uniref:BRO family protein n=1 Tax=Gordonia sp. PP30 TaxID=2935861 RepID=UPI001FFEC8A9|nr:BRO family protein [Gordonia sp. PP30]UQE74238.1 hypothetical protein MYK68_16120 [Gordonia sp. PP30]